MYIISSIVYLYGTELKVKCFIILLIITLTPLFGRQNKLDSLEKEYNLAVERKEYDKLYFIIANQLYISNKFDFKLSLKYAAKGLETANEINDKSLIAAMYNQIGRAYKNIGQFDFSFEYYFKSIKAFIEIEKYNGAAFSYIDLGNLFFSKEQFDNAKDMYLKAIEISQKEKDNSHYLPTSVSYNNIGLIHKFFNNHDSALYYFDKALEIRKEGNLNYLFPHSWNYIAEIYMRKKEYEKSIKLYKQSIDECSKVIAENEKLKKELKPEFYFITETNDFFFEAMLGLLSNYIELNKKEEVKIMSEEIELLLENEYKDYRIMYLKAMHSFYTRNNDDKKTISTAKIMYNLANQMNSDDYKIDALKYLINYYKNKQDIVNAYNYMNIYDSLKNTISQKSLNDITYNLQKNESISKTKEIIEDIEKKKEDEIRFSTVLRNLSVIIVALLFFLSLFLYKRYKINNSLMVFLKSVIDSISIPFYVINSNTKKIELANRIAEVFNVNTNSIFAEGNNIFYPIESNDCDRINDTISTNSQQFEIKEILNELGEKKYLSIYNFPILNSQHKVDKVIEYVVDITNNKMSEIERDNLINDLKLTNNALEFETDKVKELNLELTISETNLKQLNATKDRLFSIIAHDLKNPIAGIKQLSDVLINEYSKLDEKEILELLTIFNDSSANVLKLLLNLLDWARLQRGELTLNPEEVNLKTVANHVIYLIKPNAIEKNIRLINNIPDNINCIADENMISTVMRNLISNSIKFSENGGTINVDSSIKNGFVEFSVEDKGVGIPHEKIAQLFKIESNISTNGTNGEKGTGLGLILCKEMIDKHQGNIWVKSEVGKGSTFYFTLPANID